MRVFGSFCIVVFACSSSTASPVKVVDLLKKQELVASTDEARRAIWIGIVSINGIEIKSTSDEHEPRVGDVLHVGRKHRVFGQPKVPSSDPSQVRFGDLSVGDRFTEDMEPSCRLMEKVERTEIQFRRWSANVNAMGVGCPAAVECYKDDAMVYKVELRESK
jgi:hypothetical protein